MHVNLRQENKFVWMVNKNSGFVLIFFLLEIYVNVIKYFHVLSRIIEAYVLKV